jgi:hypothetical protein
VPKPGEIVVQKLEPGESLPSLPVVEHEDRIAFAIEKIAEDGLAPSPDKPWKGKAALVAHLREELSVSAEDAERIVADAVADLFSANKDNQNHVRRKLLEVRLTKYRDALRTVVFSRDAGGEMISQYINVVETEEGSPQYGKKKLNEQGHPVLVKVPKREVKYTKFDAVAAKLLLDIEEMLIRLHRLDSDGGNEDALAALFEKLEKTTGEDGAESTKHTTVMSVAQKVKAGKLKDLGAAGRAMLEQAMAEHGKSKKVKSKEVPSEDAQ